MTPPILTLAAELKALAEKATPGPWTATDQGFTEPTFWITAEHPKAGTVSIAEIRSGCDEADELASVEDNAAYIAACSPEHILALIAELERLSVKEGE